MPRYSELLESLKSQPRRWLVTGVAGFIGSNLLETLLANGQEVVGLDNFATGNKANVEEMLAQAPASRKFHFLEGDITDLATCQKACCGVDYVLHQAALGSVPRSIADPLATHASNATGFLNMLVAAREQKVRRFVYASSSSVYGDDATLPKFENKAGQPLSPYAITKALNEMYAAVYHRLHGLETIGLRYFNVFGPRQDPNGPYAAVIPRWVSAMIHQQPAYINGDGSTSRDFCYVANAVQANLLAATTENTAAPGQVFNVAVHARTSLNELFELIRTKLMPDFPALAKYRPVYQPFRPGDIQHSLADISKARESLGYEPLYTLDKGLEAALGWYKRQALSKC